MDGDELAEDVAVADPDRRFLALVAAVLGALAQHGPVADEIVAAQVSGPLRQAWASMTHPGPISTGPSITAYGPTRTSAASNASRSITAVGWISSDRIVAIALLLLSRRIAWTLRPPSRHRNDGEFPA